MCASNRTAITKKLILRPDKCTACMLCVLACSLHHAQTFDRKIASVEVIVSGKERKTHILIHREKNGDRLACDYCEGEKEPLCVKYCNSEAIILRKDD